MNERANQALLETAHGEWASAGVWISCGVWACRSGGRVAPTLAVLPGTRCVGAAGTDTGSSKGAVWSKDFLAPGGLCPSPSGLSTCLVGLQNSVPNTYARGDSSLGDTASGERKSCSSLQLRPLVPPSQASPDDGGHLHPETNGPQSLTPHACRKP